MPKPSAERIRTVLEELYAMDPSLRAHGPKLEQAVAALLAARPDVRVDPQFAAKLRTQIGQQTKQPSSSTTSSPMKNPLFQIGLPTAAIATVAIIVAVVIMQPHLLSLSNKQQEPTHTDEYAPAAGVSISRVDNRAYGELFASATAGLGSSPEAISVRPQSGGGGGGSSVPPMPSYGITEDAAFAEGSVTRMIAPDSYVYERPRYAFEGTLPEIAATGDVYRRIKTPITGLGGSLTNANLGFLNLGGFGNAQLTQFSLTQPGPYGYQLYVDLNEGSVNINQDWATWPQQTTMSPCPADGGCGEYQPLEASRVPDDATLTAITDAFLNEHGIATDAYGTPVVDRRWNVIQPYMKEEVGESTEAMIMRWAPETITVMYPLVLNGYTTYDQSGLPYGLSVSVNIRENRVSNVWNLTTLNYEASAYDLIADAAAIRDMASRGDQYAGPFGQDPNEQIRDFLLSTPTLVLMQTWHTTPNGGGEELLVPALRFPVIPDADGSTGYREAVIVPLVKGLTEPIYRTQSGTGINAVAPEPAVDAPIFRQP